MENYWYLMKGDHVICEGTADVIREEIENRLERILGFFVMLQECEDEDEFLVYLHSDNEDDLTDEQLNKLEEYGIVIDKDEETSKEIMELLGVYVVKG